MASTIERDVSGAARRVVGRVGRYWDSLGRGWKAAVLGVGVVLVQLVPV